MKNIYINGWKESFNFKGKTKRGEYWLFYLINVIIYFVLETISEPLENIYILASIVPMLSITCRRLNDVNKSFIWCIPSFVYWLIVSSLNFLVPSNMHPIFFPLIGLLALVALIPTIVLLVYTLRSSAEQGGKETNQ